MTRQMTGAKMVVQALKDQGVDTVFGYPGGAVLPIYDEIFQQNGIRHYLVRHEQGAVHAAEGYARSTGKPGVVLVTSGPGATNAVTGLTDAPFFIQERCFDPYISHNPEVGGGYIKGIIIYRALHPHSYRVRDIR